METDCVKKFIKIIKQQNEIDKQNILDTTISELNLLICKNNNLIKILVNLNDIDNELVDISFCVRYEVYNHIFSKQFYDKMLNSLLEFVLNDNIVSNNDYFNGYLKYLIYGGIMCEIIKIYYYNNIIKNVTSNNYAKNNNLTIKAVKNTIKKTFLEEKEKEILFIKQLFNDAKKYYINDDIFNDIINLIKDNGLENIVVL